MNLIQVTFLIAAISAPVFLYVIPRKAKKEPPRTKGFALVGSLFSYLPYMLNRRMFDYFLKKQHELGPICVIDVFGRDRVAVSDPAAMKRILTSSDFSRSDILIRNSKDIMEYPLFGMETGDIWRTHRKAIMAGMGPSFLKKAFTATLHSMDELRRVFDDKIQTSPNGEIVVDIRDYLSHVTLDVIMSSSFSLPMDNLQTFAHSKNGQSSLREHMDILGRVVVYRMMLPTWLYRYFGTLPSQIAPTVQFFKALVNSFVVPRKDGSIQEEGDLLEILLAKTSEGTHKFTDEELKDETLSILLAGHETTANSLANVLLALCNNPHVLSRLLSEIDALLPSETARLTLDDLAKFKYLDNVFRETMRYYPVVFGVFRVAEKEVDVMGYTFPKGTYFMPHFSGLHTDKSIWGDDVNEFNPDRFDQGDMDAYLMPFSAGPHVCPGMKMAIMESKVVLIKLLQQFSLELIPGQDLNHLHAIALHLPNGLKLKITKRI
ncbi:cytochrome P450 [Rhizoclosmatium globosum]|uniref:Cytochrome P450 n=1 Tax=Rhizoclosmatium globosum TaxID=329046 RepID=A0A1Y2CGB2_9FUNG|nr:cytochrome P450 [Rhizoclosmatium globosum]|eukprot:ORY46093.1 cytochrome P450 [Rhizoclosmatium globosum]